MTTPLHSTEAPAPAAAPDQLDQLMQLTSPRYWIALGGIGLVLLLALLWGLFGTLSITVEGQGVLMRRGGIQDIHAAEAGTVTAIKVESGQRVEKGDVLLTLAMNHAGSPQSGQVVAPYAALVARRIARVGEKVKKDTALLTLDPVGEPLQVRLYLPCSDGYRVDKGQVVHVFPAHAKSSEHGYLLGSVAAVGKFPSSKSEMQERLQSEEMVQQLSKNGPCLQVIVELQVDKDSVSGHKWSSEQGRELQLYSGIPCQARIIMEDYRPIELLFPALHHRRGP